MQASGIHARHAPYYIRTVRGDKKDPLCQFMVEKGIPHESDVKPNQNIHGYFLFLLKLRKKRNVQE